MKKYISSICALMIAVAGMAQKVDRSKAPAAGPAPKIQIGSYQNFTMDNGLKVIVVENHKLPNVSYSLQLEIDPIKEGEKAGYVSFAGDMMSKGTTTRSKDEITSSIDFIGAQFSSGSDGIFGACLTKHSEKMLDIFSDVLLHPSFPETELEKAKKKTISGLISEKTDPNSISSKIGNMVTYGKNHPYGEQMTEETVKNITREDIVNYYNNYFKPNVAYLIIVGDITMETAKAQANKYFASWTRGDVPKMKFRAPKLPGGNEVVFVPMPGAVQSVINITYPIDLIPTTQDALVASVLNNILGGSGFQTRLMQNLREDKAYTYGAYSDIAADDYVGNFSAGASVRNEVTDSSITQIMFEISKLTTEAVDDKTLQIVKNIMTGQFARSLERPQTVARFAKNIDKYGLPKNFYETYLERLNAVTSMDILTLAKRVLLPNNAYITVVGNKEIESKITAFDADGKILKFNPDGSVFVDMRPAPADVTTQVVFNNYIQAVGGKDKIAKIKSFEQKGKFDVGMAKLDMQSVCIANTALRMVVSMNGNAMMTQTWDGTKMQISQMGQSMEAGEAEILQAKIQSDLLAELHYADFGIQSQLKGIEVVNGADMYVIENIYANGLVSTDYFDVKTGLRMKTITVQKVGETAQTSETTIVSYGETKDGIKYPSVVKQNAGGQMVEITISEFNLNPKVKKKDFKI
jgi:predicted Zn-dependent peptidase